MADSSETTPRIFIWAVPRTCSTALAKCLSFVDGAQVWMEPYESSLANNTFYNPDFKKGDPLAEKMRAGISMKEGSETMKALRREMADKIGDLPNIVDQKDISYTWTKKQLEQPPARGVKFIIIKDQSSAVIDHLQYLPDVPNCRHVFLIRHPREVYVSFKEFIWKRLGLEDTCSWETCHAANDAPYYPVKDLFSNHNQLWKHIQKISEIQPIVMDAFDLLTKPEEMLPKLFSKLGIPYHEKYLEWDASSESIEKMWKGSADYVLLEPKTIAYKRAAHSSRFEAPKQPWGIQSNQELEVTPELKEFIDSAMPFYMEMHAERI